MQSAGQTRPVALGRATPKRYSGSSRTMQSRYGRFRRRRALPGTLAAQAELGVRALAGDPAAITELGGSPPRSRFTPSSSPFPSYPPIGPSQALGVSRVESASVPPRDNLPVPFSSPPRSSSRAADVSRVEFASVPPRNDAPVRPSSPPMGPSQAPGVSRVESAPVPPRNNTSDVPASESSRPRAGARDARLRDSMQARCAQFASHLQGVDIAALLPVAGPPPSSSTADFDISSFSPYVGVTAAIPLVAAETDLPAEGVGSVEMLPALPEADAASWAAPSSVLLRSEEELSNVTLPKAHVYATPEQYRLLLRRLLRLNMVALRTRKPLVLNGLFGVRKPDGLIRLIVDARAANLLFREPLDPALPSPADVATLALEIGQQLLIAKTDLAACFHSIRTPDWLHDLFGLPAVRAGDLGLTDVAADVWVWPVFQTLPMGFSWSVLIVQRINVRLLLRSGVIMRDLVLRGNVDVSLEHVRVVVYIDDVVFLGLRQHRERIAAAQARYIAEARSCGFVLKDVKIKLPQERLDVLGIVMDGVAGTYAPDPLKLVKVAAHARSIIVRRSVPLRELASVVGKLTWAALCFRPALSAFGAIYQTLRSARLAGAQHVRVGPSSRYELRLMLSLLPLLVADLRARWFQHALASDASLTGIGVVATTPPAYVIKEASLLHGAVTLPSRAGRDVLHPAADAILSQRFRTLVSAPVRYPAHINQLETVAATTALRWALSTPTAIGSRILVFCDSTVVVSALSKGRSSSRTSNAVRRHAAFALASGCRTTFVWVPSERNPADAASRRFGSA